MNKQHSPVDRFGDELKSKYPTEQAFWNAYFQARDEYYESLEEET